MSKTRKKRSQSKKAIEAALQIALEQARILETAATIPAPGSATK